MKIPVMSRSGLEASLCGHRYNALYNEGMTDDSPYSLRGSAYHLVKRKYVQRLAAAKTPMDHEEAEKAFQEGIRESKCPPQLVPEVHNLFFRHVEHFELPLDAYLAAEDRRVREDADVPYQFTPDLELGWTERNELEIVDDKSFYRSFTEAQAREFVQTRFYIWAAMQEWPGWASYRFTYDFIRLNVKTSVVFYPVDFDMLDREIRGMNAARLQRYEDHDWTASPGDVCAFCNLACPVLDDPKRAYLRVNDTRSFELVAGAKVVLEKTLAEMNKVLKAYVNVKGPQDVQGEIFDFRPSVSEKYPIASVVDTLRAESAEPVQANITAAALKKTFKEHPWLEEDLAPVKIRKETAKFGHKSKKSDFRDRPDEDSDDE